MEERFEWREEFELGVASIDKDHKQLFKIINRLFAVQAEGKSSQWACQEGLKFFKAHALTHFADEEKYMASIRYSGLEQHRLIHRTFRDQTLPALERELEETEYSQEAVDHFLGVCAGWLIGHTLTEDRAIVQNQLGQWTGLLPGEEREAMKKVIVQLVFDMFRLESQVVSDIYAGERFGTGVYYHLVYGKAGDDKKLEIVLIFEEQLLIKTVGKIMGIQTNRLDNMLIHAVRYTARQFSDRVLECFPSMEGYHLEEDDLLTHKQFRKVIEKETPQVSLLLNTGAGYFAYCTIAPHLLEEGIGTPLSNDNAVAEVEKYLTRRRAKEESIRETHKQKILVVDDSATIRQGMKQMLEKEYLVSVAESGVAAIRAITLNPPDLVLLDYEMPVCDGRQTLEMLRSEEAFANIPVIFLTGRRDPESMIKVMPLNPSGYLLKNSKPGDIKKEIDTFMQKLREKEEK